MWLEFLQKKSIGTGFYGDVVLDNFNKAFIDENSILDLLYEKQIFLDHYFDEF